MTRASLLHILDHVSGISETEIRELEQLATAFPYCQTAHVLLAKAAHDRGSMLASQRLRRAATYAADRQLLRRLLEQPAAEQVLLNAAPPQLANAPATERPAPAGSTAAFLQTLGAEDVQPFPEESSPPEPEATDGTSATLVTEDTLPAELETAFPAAPTPEPAPAALAADDVPEPATPAANAGASTPAEAAPAALPAAPEAATALHSDSETAAPAAFVAPAVEVEAEQPAETATAVAETVSTVEPVAADTSPASDTDELLPAVAPPIRPPADAGISRFEFGLAEAPALPEPAAYQLPDDDADEAAYQLPAPPPAAVPAFYADAALAYALLGGGSRLGYALQAQDGELAAALPADEFFEPDALLQAHAMAHRPKPRPVPSSLDLINRFLQNQPRLKSPAVRPVATEEQADLSVRSTSVQPQLASESLANIMVRQGKIDKAIEIYERLMVRQPEKSAYFASQIQQLQTPE